MKLSIRPFILSVIALAGITFSIYQCEKPEPDKSKANALTALVVSVGSTDYTGTIAGTNVTFANKVPNGKTEVSIKTITFSDKATASKKAGDKLTVGTANTITVTAEDGTAANYSATINAEEPTPPGVVTRKPSVSTSDVTNITVSGATLSGTLVDVGTSSVSAHGHVWGTTNNPTITGNGVSKNDLGTATTSGTSFSTSVSGLSENTTYYIRAYASNNVGTGYGVVKEFKTLENATLGEISGSSQVSITISGSGTSTTVIVSSTIAKKGSGIITQHGHVYSTTAQNDNLVIGADNVFHSELGTKSEEGDFTSVLQNLNAFSTYYVRPYIITNGTIIYGQQGSFMTPAGAPSVTLGSANPTLNSITISGTITNLGGNEATVTAYGHIWGTTSGNLTTASSNINDIGSSSETRSFESTFTGLTKNTEYFFVAFATNDTGTAYSEVQSYSTLNDENEIRSLTIAVSGTSFTQTRSVADNTITGTTIGFKGLPYGATQAEVTAITLSNQATATLAVNDLTQGSVLAVGNNNVTVRASNGGTQAYTIALSNELPVAPTVVTLSSENITLNSATLKGQITDFGISPISGYGFVYSPLSNTGNPVLLYSDNLDTNSGVFSSNITGLSSGTIYAVGAFATNEGENVGGSNVEIFSTLSSMDKNINSLTITVNGSNQMFNGTITGTEITFSGNIPYVTQATIAAISISDYATASKVRGDIIAVTGESIVITAQDNTTKTYNVTISTLPSHLKNIEALAVTVSGSSTIYNSAITGTTIEFPSVPAGTSEVIIETLELSRFATANKNVGDILPITGDSIIVTAQDNTTATYPINLDSTPSDENAITQLVVTISGTDYTATITGTNITFPSNIPFGADQGTITTLRTSNFANADTNEGDTINLGETITIIVTAEDSTTATYSFTINTIPASTNKDLTQMEVTISGTSYAATITGTNITFPSNIPYGPDQGTISTLRVSEFANADTDEGATVNLGEATTVVVTAQDGSTASYNFTINTIPASTNKDLTQLEATINGTTYAATITGTDITFPNNIPYGPTQGTISTLRVSNFANADTDEGATVNLGEATTVVVTAQDGSTTSYSFTINTVPASTENAITSMNVTITGNNTVFTGTFSSNDIIFDTTLPFGTTGSSIKINALEYSEFATVDKNVGYTFTSLTGESIIVTAQDGSTNTYNIIVNTVPASSDKAITALAVTVSGSSTTYTASLSGATHYVVNGTPYGTTEVIISTLTLSDFATADKSESEAVNIAGETIVVTAQDGSSTTYNLTVNTVPPSSSKAITALTVTVTGSSTTYTASLSGASTYEVDGVPYGTTQVIISTLTVSDFATADKSPNETVNITGETIVVTAQDGSSTTYNFIVNPAPPSSAKAITSLVVTVSGSSNTFTASPSGGTNYVINNVPYGSTEVIITSLAVSDYATADKSENDTMPITGDSIVVTAQDGSSTTYNVSINTGPQSSDKAITSLIVSVSGSNETYSASLSGASEYVVNAPYGTTEVIISTLTLSDFATADKSVSDAIPLTGDSIVVTAQDGSMATYSVSITVSSVLATGNSVNTISFSVSGSSMSYLGTISGGDTIIATLPNGSTEAVIASLNLSSFATSNKNVDDSISLTGDSMIITAQDGSTKTYTFNFSVSAVSTQKNIESITFSFTISSESMTYAGTVSNNNITTSGIPYYDSTGTLAISNLEISDYATANKSVGSTALLGNNYNYITVTAQDSSTKTYGLSANYIGMREGSKEFETRAISGSINQTFRPSGIWSDGTTMWIANDNGAHGLAKAIYAFNLSTGDSDNSKTIHLHSDNGHLNGIASDGTTMYVSDYDDDKIYAYTIATGARDTSKESGTIPDINGMWVEDSTTIWLSNELHDLVRPYNLSDWTINNSIPASSVDGNPYGIWSDGTTLWVAEDTDDEIIGFDLSTGNRNIFKDFKRLAFFNNRNPFGIWSDGTTMYVADWQDQRVYAYSF